MHTKTLITLLLLNLSFYSLAQETISIDSIRQYFYEEINTARADPHAYLANQNWYEEPFTISRKLYGSKPALILNDSLSLVCQEYAELLSEKDTLVHSAAVNYRESNGYNLYYFDMILSFITEFNSNSPDGHRKHLLGQNNNDTQIGIGVAINSDGLIFTCIRTIE